MKRGRRRKFNFPVECYSCGKEFDFGDYLTFEDESKHIAEIVVEKCGGNELLCDDCRRRKARVLESGRFEFVKKFDDSFADLILISDNGERRILAVEYVGEDGIALVTKDGSTKER